MCKIHILCLWLICLLFCSCLDSHVQVTVFPETKQLLAEKVFVEEIFAADFVEKAGDNFVISSTKTDTTLFLYATPTLKFKSATGLKGEGPNEVKMFPMFCHTLDEDFLYIRGYEPYSIRKIKLQEDGSFSFVGMYHLDGGEYNFMNVIKDSLLVYYEGNHLTVTKYDLKNKVKLGEIKKETDSHNESYYYSNRGLISANDSFVVYPYIYKKQIDIYRVDDFNLVKRISDGNKYPAPSIRDAKNITYHYFNVYAGSKYFYALYMGHKADENFSDRTLEVYDYDGNPIVKYTFDIIPHYFAVDEKEGYIYATNSNYEDYLLRYKL